MATYDDELKKDGKWPTVYRVGDPEPLTDEPLTPDDYAWQLNAWMEAQDAEQEGTDSNCDNVGDSVDGGTVDAVMARIEALEASEKSHYQMICNWAGRINQLDDAHNALCDALSLDMTTPNVSNTFRNAISKARLAQPEQRGGYEPTQGEIDKLMALTEEAQDVRGHTNVEGVQSGVGQEAKAKEDDAVGGGNIGSNADSEGINAKLSALEYINDTPELLSYLYDINLLPEQLLNDSPAKRALCAIAALHMKWVESREAQDESQDSANEDDGRDVPTRKEALHDKPMDAKTAPVQSVQLDNDALKAQNSAMRDAVDVLRDTSWQSDDVRGRSLWVRKRDKVLAKLGAQESEG